MPRHAFPTFPIQPSNLILDNTNRNCVSVAQLAEARSFLFVGFSRAAVIVHRTYVPVGVSSRDTKRGKRRGRRAADSQSAASPGRGEARASTRVNIDAEHAVIVRRKCRSTQPHNSPSLCAHPRNPSVMKILLGGRIRMNDGNRSQGGCREVDKRLFLPGIVVANVVMAIKIREGLGFGGWPVMGI